MDQKLTRAIEDLEIRQILARYCRGVDRLDEAMVLSCFWPPSPDGPAVFCGPFRGSPRDWVDYVFARMRSDLLTTHHLCQSLIVIDGCDAETETYFLARHVYNENDGVTVMQVAGRYLDRLQQRGGDWKITRRTVKIDMRQFGPAGPADGTTGEIGRKADDPSFDLRLLGSA